MKDLLGVILCGGESKRMGSDKGLLQIQDTTWALFMADKLSFLQVPVLFSINKNQFTSYNKNILTENLVIDDDVLKGPATGLLTVHRKFPDKDIFLLACDMLELDVATIKKLVNVYSVENNYDYYVYQDAAYAQPLCGIYTAKGMNQLQKDIRAHSFTSISMQYVLNNGNTKRLEIENNKAFRNFNSK